MKTWIRSLIPGLFSAMIFVVAGCSSKPHVHWTAYTPEEMSEALKPGQPTFVYFYAAWCGPCMQLKERTFTDSRVIVALEPYHRIKVDMSYIRSPKIQKISDEFGIPGLPTLILFDPSGKSYFKHSGFVTADQLLGVLEKFRNEFHLPAPATIPNPE